MSRTPNAPDSPRSRTIIQILGIAIVFLIGVIIVASWGAVAAAPEGDPIRTIVPTVTLVVAVVSIIVGFALQQSKRNDYRRNHMVRR
jgi:Flp pilus assembly protein CpaB